MYQTFFGFRELPFEITPNPKHMFLSSQHREALGNLQYGLSSSKAITVLIGEAGTGKTTLLHAALASDRCRHVSSVSINSPTLTRPEFVEMLAVRFGLSPHAAESKTALLTELEPLLIEQRSEGKIVALVVDEAQCLSDELLEEIRLLANCETETEKLLARRAGGSARAAGSPQRAGPASVEAACDAALRAAAVQARGNGHVHRDARQGRRR